MIPIHSGQKENNKKYQTERCQYPKRQAVVKHRCDRDDSTMRSLYIPALHPAARIVAISAYVYRVLSMSRKLRNFFNEFNEETALFCPSTVEENLHDPFDSLR